MPSTVVHVALGGIVAVGLLGSYFDRRALVLVLAAAAFPDLDTPLGIWIRGGHRTLFHTLLLPGALAVLWYVDAARGDRSRLRSRYGERGVRVAGVAVAALAFAGVGPDLFTNGVNALWPLHDQFYKLNGELLLSNQRGVVQTFLDLHLDRLLGHAGDGAAGGSGGGGAVAGKAAVGSTRQVHYSTGVDPTAGPDPANVERVFPLVTDGMQLLLVLLSAFLVTARLRRSTPRA
ncbi:MAG: metal-dependent hydrolase [Halobacteriaceae archaeon]